MTEAKKAKPDAHVIRDLTAGIWYNLPYPGHISTWSSCVRKGCGNFARGAGRCLECAEKDLASVVGDVCAFKYVSAVRTVRELEKRMRLRSGEVAEWEGEGEP